MAKILSFKEWLKKREEQKQNTTDQKQRNSQNADEKSTVKQEPADKIKFKDKSPLHKMTFKKFREQLDEYQYKSKNQSRKVNS